MNKIFKISNKCYYIPSLMCLCNTSDEENTPDFNFVREILKKNNKENDILSLNCKTQKIPQYFPLHIDIFPTYECNLRCQYCYSGTGDYIPRSLNKNQIDKIIKELTKTVRMKKLVTRNEENIDTEIFLAGGGEPTYNWELFEYIVEKAKIAALENDYKVRFGIVTNGYIDDVNKIKYICDNFTYIQVSVDGAAIEQDLHRPTVTGEKSSNVVYAFINECLNRGNLVGLRMTVSSETVSTLDLSIDYLSKRFSSVSHIQVEPLSINSKVISNSLTAPAPEVFVDKYMESWHMLKGTGIGLFSSTANVFSRRESDHFCDAIAGGTIIVNPDGYLSTCYEASTDIEEMKNGFFLGKIDERGELQWFAEGPCLQHHQCYHDGCEKCIAWEFCKGGCTASMVRNKENRRFHCKITKGLTKKIINEISNNANSNIDVNLHIIDSPCDSINNIIYWVDRENGTKLILSKV